MKKFFGYLFLVFGMAFALSYFQNSSVNALDGSYDDAIMGQSSHIDQDENKIEDIIFLIDTSGSISEEDLNNFLYQAYNVCKDFEAQGVAIFFDSIVQDVFKINKKNKDVI